MKPLSALKRLFFAGAGSAPVVAARLRRLRGGKALTILNFHRVAPPDGSSYPPLDPGLFDDVVRFCCRHFRPVTFGDLAERRRGGGKPPVILSFDDGYLDFAEHAVPVLRRHGVRVNHNIIPAAIESGLPPLNVQVRDFIGQAPADALQRFRVPGQKPFNAAEGRQQFSNRVAAHLKSKPMAQQKALHARLRPQMDAVEGFRPTRMMSLSDVRAIDGEHEIGAHSYEHATLAAESDDYIRNDAKQCRRWFGERLGRVPDIYALPNGGGDERVASLLRAEGFRHILWTGEGRSHVGSTDHPRFTMAGENRREVRFRATGWQRG